MMQLLAGKVVVVTGSSTGIGRSIALECARHGARMVLHHIGDTQSLVDVHSLKESIDVLNEEMGLKAEAVDIAVDVTLPEAGERIVAKAISAYGKIDCVVHNAGIAQFTEYEAVTAAQRDLHMAVNFAGPFSITQAVVAQMKLQGKGGSIVCIASVTATYGASQLTHYAPTKAAVLGWMTSAAVALGKFGIRFNAVSPGTIETAINKADLAGPKRIVMEGRVPLQRLGIPEDIAKPVVFMLSDLSQYVTGQNLVVDGGATINYQ